MSRFQTGQVKPEGSGRKKGTPNKKTLDLAEKLRAEGLDPVLELIKLLPLLEPQQKANVLLDLMTYLYPKRKAMDLKVDEPAQLSGQPCKVIFQVAKTDPDRPPDIWYE
jgi:hypothetical protein